MEGAAGVTGQAREPLYSREFLRVLLVHFLAMFSTGIYLFLPRFIRLTGGREFLIGLIMGAPFMMAVLARLPAGAWIDRQGRRKMMTTGLLFFALASALPVFAPGAGLYLLVVRALAGAASVIYFTAVVTYVAEMAPAGRRAEAVAIYGAGGFIAQAISPYLCEWLLGVLPLAMSLRYRALFLLAAVACFAAFLMSLGLSPDRPHQERHLRPDAWTRVIRTRTMLYLVVPSLVFGLGYTAMFSFITDFTQQAGLGSPSAFFVAYSLTVIALRVGTGPLLDRADRRMVVAGALAMIALGLFQASRAAGTLDLVLVGILTGTGHGYIFPSLSTMTYDSSPPRNRGTSMALYMLGYDLSITAMSPLLGHLAELRGYFMMYRVSAVLLAVGTLVYLTGWRYHAPAALERSANGGRKEFIPEPGALR